MFIINVFKNKFIDSEDFLMALNCARGALEMLLDDENLEVVIDENLSQISVRVISGLTPVKSYSLREFEELSKYAFMEDGIVYEQFERLEALKI